MMQLNPLNLLSREGGHEEEYDQGNAQQLPFQHSLSQFQDKINPSQHKHTDIDTESTKSKTAKPAKAVSHKIEHKKKPHHKQLSNQLANYLLLPDTVLAAKLKQLVLRRLDNPEEHTQPARKELEQLLAQLNKTDSFKTLDPKLKALGLSLLDGAKMSQQFNSKERASKASHAVPNYSAVQQNLETAEKMVSHQASQQKAISAALTATMPLSQASDVQPKTSPSAMLLAQEKQQQWVEQMSATQSTQTGEMNALVAGTTQHLTRNKVRLQSSLSQGQTLFSHHVANEHGQLAKEAHLDQAERPEADFNNTLVQGSDNGSQILSGNSFATLLSANDSQSDHKTLQDNGLLSFSVSGGVNVSLDKAQLTQSPPILNQTLATPEWENAFQQQVTFFIKNRIHQAEIRLHPKELGTIKVNMSLHNDQLKLNFTADNQQASTSIAMSMQHLKNALTENGLHLESVMINQELFNGETFSQQQSFQQQGQTESDLNDEEESRPMLTTKEITMTPSVVSNRSLDVFA